MPVLSFSASEQGNSILSFGEYIGDSPRLNTGEIFMPSRSSCTYSTHDNPDTTFRGGKAVDNFDVDGDGAECQFHP